VLLYRVNEGPETRALALDDAKAGLALLRKRGGEFGLAARPLGVLGFSAGGHLCARLAHETAAAGAPPDFAVLMYPAYLEKDGQLLEDIAPTKVPAFLYVAEDDKFSRSSRVFEAACKEKGVPCEAHYAAKGGHGFGLKQPLPDGVKDWPEKLRAFLGRQGQ
jgi:acetyl esterase/lipase